MNARKSSFLRLWSRRWSALTAVFAVLLLSALPSVGTAQLTLSLSPTTPCTAPYTCCTEFTIDANTAVQIDITSSLTSPSTSCFDWACFTAQGGGLTYTHTPLSNTVTVTNSTGGPLNFTLCGDPACMAANDLFNALWHRTDGGKGGGNLPLNSCGGTPVDPCLHCDHIHAWTDRYVCLTRGSINSCPSCFFRITFSPELPICVQTNGLVPGSYDATDWSPSFVTNPNGVSEIDFTNIDPTGGSCLLPCETFCFRLPDCCSPDPHNPKRTICVNFLTTFITGLTTTPGTCIPANTACGAQSWTLKPANGGDVDAPPSSGAVEQNYPNPLSATTEFKTTIPFTTSAAGQAAITVVNEKGQQVLSDNMEVLGAGEHNFYFTGEKLPAGKYFYRIEFPKGVVIVSKSLLIVK